MMDPANTLLGEMLAEEITPVVMVLSTPAVEESCLKNGLSFLQMLTPFCFFNNIDVPVRTASDQPYRLQKFKLRLFYAADVRRPNLEVAKGKLKQVITQSGEKDLHELCLESPQISNVLASSVSGNLPSWFRLFNKELVRMVSFSDHEAFDHPVACLLAVSSKDEQPINRFVDLFNTNKLPSLINDGAMDPKIWKHYLLVHDNQDGPPERATKILVEMRSTFGSSDCQLLCINSSQDAPFQHQSNPWASYSFNSSSIQNLGCFLNMDDISEIKDLMQDLSSKHIIPNMEQKIRMLNQHVSATRKGFRNQIKNLWWRKGKEDAVDSQNGPMYTYSSIESQIRVLGDYAFMLQDYELALSNYRLISTDYKLDKAWKRYAGVQEMMGLAYFMLDQSRKEVEYCMENAFTTYLKLGPPGQQNATRCGLWWIEILKAWDQYKEAATVYFRICGEDLLHSAVMLEQASYCYLLSKPSMLRKYGFHLVLAGDHYKKCDQIKHAVRTYKGAVSVFKGSAWNHINDHVNFHIGEWYAFLGMYDVAVEHMLEVLACTHQSKTTQELFLKDFLHIVQKTGKTHEVLKLQLPVINISSLKVVFEDHRTYASAEAASAKESLWHSLEEEMIPSLSTARTNWLELQSKMISRNYRDTNICVAGEAVKVDIEFKNPLQISLNISGVSLICKLSPKTDETISDEMKSGMENDDDNCDKSNTKRDISSDNLFILSEADFSLGGNETTMVQLTVTAIVEGVLQIIGVRWKLSGSVVGFHNFESNNLKKNATKGRRKSKRSPTDNLTFMVIKSIPKLQGFVQPVPEKAYVGHLRQLFLDLRNQSEFPVKNLKMKINHPRFLLIGNQDNLKREFPACLEKDKGVGQNGENASSNYMSNTVFHFPEDISIQGETPLVWPIWLRAAIPGSISLFISIYYEIGEVSSVIRYRTLRMHYNLQVLPSLDVSFQISPSASRLQEFLVRMDVVNKTTSDNFQVYQLSSIGCQWEISLLQPPDTFFPSQSLKAGQALSCFFILKACRKIWTSEENLSDNSPHNGSDVRLIPESNKDPFYDVTCSPLVNFHHCERQQQSSHELGDVNIVDFILISRTLNTLTNTGSSDSPHLLSHHACHCSLESTGPISWLLEGPRTLHHSFSASFCEIKLKMSFYNSAGVTAFVRINTFNSSSMNLVQSANPVNEAGWHDASPANDTKVISSILGTAPAKSLTLESVTPFFWSGASSTRFQLAPMSSAQIPLQICVFSPGTYDLSNYVIHWNLSTSGNQENQDEMRNSSGTCQGYPYYLTVLQTT